MKASSEMRKFKHFTLGGIQQKIFNLVLIMIILVIAAYSVVIFHQINAISGLVTETNDKQKASITETSKKTMDAVIAQSLTTSTQLQAQIANDMFSDTANAVSTIGDYAKMLFEAPEGREAHEVALPDAAKDGTACVQLLTEEGVDPADPAIAEKVRLAGNLSEILLSVYSHAELDSIYVALPEGVMLLVDNHPSSKFGSNGEILSIAMRDRDWYKGASETGGLYFTDIISDVFTGKTCIMCAVPVFADGKLAAVIGADLFLDNMQKYVNAMSEKNGFVCIVNNRGHVVFSPAAEGIFQVKANSGAEDLRTLGSSEFASFLEEAMRENTDVRLLQVDGKDWYMTGAPISAVGWSVLSLVSKEAADQPTLMMETQHETILAEAKGVFSTGISNARTMILVLLGIVTVLALTGAAILASRIVKPLTRMTERVVSLGGEDLQFRMEDTYRTGDEVEALAESFATLSARTLRYVDQVRAVTAEKERIGTELALATNIQASMLPHIYPAFPERPEFDIFASMDPAKEVGGDFYDYFLVDDDHLCIVIADVSGKGVPAALFMMASKIILQSTAMLGYSPAEIMARTNQAICSNNEAQMFVTVWLGILELSTGKLVAANAGHELPAVKHPDGKFELYKDKHGFVVGGMEGIKYRPYELQLEPGSKLFLYTDGVAEATSAEKELFGTERMIDALNADPDASPEQLLKNVRAHVDGFVKEAEQFDDLTMLCVEYRGSGKEAKQG